MNRLFAAAAMAAAAGIALAAQNASEVERHITAARTAAGSEHAGMVDRLCPAVPAATPAGAPAAGRGRAGGAGGGRRGGGPPPPPPREQ